MVIENTGTSDDLDSHWTFVSQVDGQPAGASGTARGHYSDRLVVTGTLIR